jgi:hypothetical protein
MPSVRSGNLAHAELRQQSAAQPSEATPQPDSAAYAGRPRRSPARTTGTITSAAERRH